MTAHARDRDDAARVDGRGRPCDGLRPTSIRIRGDGDGEAGEGEACRLAAALHELNRSSVNVAGAARRERWRRARRRAISVLMDAIMFSTEQTSN
jgi:hypothetical protein